MQSPLQSKIDNNKYILLILMLLLPTIIIVMLIITTIHKYLLFIIKKETRNSSENKRENICSTMLRETFYIKEVKILIFEFVRVRPLVARHTLTRYNYSCQWLRKNILYVYVYPKESHFLSVRLNRVSKSHQQDVSPVCKCV